MVIAIDVEAVPVQAVAAQLGGAVGQLAQLRVQLLSVQPGARGIRVVGTDTIYSGAWLVFLSPQHCQPAASIQGTNAALLEHGTEQLLQGPICDVE